jgi:hypothetical protein
MTTRLTRAEIVAELHEALADGGWIPAATSGDGPGPLPRESVSLSEVAPALVKHSHAASLPPSVSLQMRRAAEAATDALEAERLSDEASVYGLLGTALAYIIQARRAWEAPEPPA